MNSPDPRDAEWNRLFRSLPNRAAPPSLEERVLAELARRASLPWWRRSYAAWPAPARAAFLIVSALAAGLISEAGLRVATTAGNGMRSGALGACGAALTALGIAARTVAAAIPPFEWQFAGVAVIALCATLFAVFAAGRRLYSSPESP